MRPARLAIVVVAVGCVIAPDAMGRGTADIRQQPNAKDQATAGKAVVRRSDLRPAAGWVGIPHGQLTTGGGPCLKVPDLVQTGGAFSQWSLGGGGLGSETARNVGNLVRIFSTPAMARMYGESMVSPTSITCTAKLVGWTHVTVEQLAAPAPHIGTSSRAVRYSFTQGTHDRVAEMVLVTKGRAELLTSEIVPASAQSALQADVIRLARLTQSRVP